MKKEGCDRGEAGPQLLELSVVKMIWLASIAVDWVKQGRGVATSILISSALVGSTGLISKSCWASAAPADATTITARAAQRRKPREGIFRLLRIWWYQKISSASSRWQWPRRSEKF